MSLASLAQESEEVDLVEDVTISLPDGFKGEEDVRGDEMEEDALIVEIPIFIPPTADPSLSNFAASCSPIAWTGKIVA